jgi:RND family efflux transporter MFP subunit
MGNSKVVRGFLGMLLPVALLAQSQSAFAQRPPEKAPAASAASSAPAPTPGAPDFSFDTAGPAGNRDISVLIIPGDETTLSSQMAGKISAIHVGLGQPVRDKDILIEFDCAEQAAQLQAAEAEYRGARETHLTKLKLQALGAAGELEVTVAAAAADKAKGQVMVREAQMAYCKVPAPFSGRIAKLRVKEAESVAVGQPLIDMVNAKSLKAQLYVPASWVRWLKPGMEFQVKTEGRRYRARVSKLNARVEGVSQALEVEARLEGSTEWLLPGMVGTAIFPKQSGR